ncbi:MAG: FAD binding domain-containing protein [Bacteroidetes bacterium]|nr:FAD binding domain-containing protein [Bacteroidota bacterium]
MIKFILNDQLVETSVLPTTVLLDFIRKEKKLTATKEGCREGDCGACTVLVGEVTGNRVKYKSVNSCLMPISDANAKHIVTVEGVSNSVLTPIQEAMVDEGGTQCGFCTPGFIVSMTGYFLNHDKFEIDKAVDSIGGNICRCTGYAGIKRALEKANVTFSGNGSQAKTHLEKLITNKFVPQYFRDIPKRLKQIPAIPTKVKSKVVIAGGTDLYVQKWEELVRSNVDFISADEKLKGIVKTKNRIRIGGAATIEEIKNSSLLQRIFPHWDEYFNLFGSMPIRNRATVGGNIVNASPIADTVNILLALDAVVHLRNGKKNREVALKNFYKGYKTLDKKPDEIIEAVSFNVPSKNFFFNFEKISKRTFLDIASVNSSIYLELTKGKISVVHISAGGVAPVPLYLAKTCKFLKTKSVNTETVLTAASISQTEISPISDARGSAEYKRLLLRQLIYAHFVKLFPEQIELPVPNTNERD